MKKLFSLFVLSALFVLPAVAQLASSGKLGTCDWTFNAQTGQLVITSADDAPEWGGELKISNPILSPFIAKDEIIEVIVEEGVSEIGTGAFMMCKNLTRISFPSTLSVMGFSSDEVAEDVVVQLPFYGCTSLRTLVFQSENAPDTDNRIFERTTEQLYGFNPALVKLYIDDESIRSFMEAGYGAFHICSLPPMSEGTFGNNNEFQWKLSRHGKLTIIGEGAMPDLESVMEEPWAQYVAEIKELVVSEGITHIGARSFGYFVNLEMAYLPASLESIGDYAFGMTSKLETIVCAAITVPAMGEDALPVVEDMKRYVYVWFYMADRFNANADWSKHQICNLNISNELLTTEDASAQPQSESSLLVTWPEVEGAKYFVITLTAEDGSLEYEITINTDRQVVSYTKRAPARWQQSVEEDYIDGLGLTIRGLETGKHYTVTIVAKDDTETIASYQISATTVSNEEEDVQNAVDEVAADAKNGNKMISNGVLLIERNGKTYNAQGSEVR